MPVPKLSRPRHRAWIALPLLAMAGIQALTGIPHPDYFAARGSEGLLANFSALAFTPSSDARNFFHIPLFAGLAASLAWSLSAWTRTTRTAFLLALVVAGLFAAVNEGSQAFVPTRAATLSDFVHDLYGVVLGVAAVALLTRGRDADQADSGATISSLGK